MSRCKECGIDLTDREFPCASKTCPQRSGLYVSDAAKNNREGMFLVDLMRELEKAVAKFPEQKRYTSVIAAAEELGEMSEAFLSLDGEGHKGHTEETLYKECVQLAVMALRVALNK